jgi:tRNA nucleotidyltransferase (CCA-adding enzyme)
MQSAGNPSEDLAAALAGAYPELAAIRSASSDPVYVVGGAVRDLLLGRGRADLDVVVVGDAFALAAKLGAEPVEHERFGTAKVTVDGHELDIAGARTETYEQPGELPQVAPAAAIEEDLGRRDFTINAMAVPLEGEVHLIDLHGGRADLEAGLLRVLHRDSFVDDPTRAIRAARYAARLDLRPESETEALLRATDLDAVSADRRRAELLRLAGEASAPRGFALLREWGLLASRGEEDDLVEWVADLAAASPWVERLAPRERARALLAAALGPAGDERELAAARPQRPSQAVDLARGHDPIELVLARALGAAWLDDYLEKWSAVTLAIDGADLIAAGVPQGPALGRGLGAALRAKLDGEIAGRDQELATALAAAEDD